MRWYHAPKGAGTAPFSRRRRRRRFSWCPPPPPTFAPSAARSILIFAQSPQDFASAASGHIQQEFAQPHWIGAPIQLGRKPTHFPPRTCIRRSRGPQKRCETLQPSPSSPSGTCTALLQPAPCAKPICAHRAILRFVPATGSTPPVNVQCNGRRSARNRRVQHPRASAGAAARGAVVVTRARRWRG